MHSWFGPSETICKRLTVEGARDGMASKKYLTCWTKSFSHSSPADWLLTQSLDTEVDSETHSVGRRLRVLCQKRSAATSPQKGVATVWDSHLSPVTKLLNIFIHGNPITINLPKKGSKKWAEKKEEENYWRC